MLIRMRMQVHRRRDHGRIEAVNLLSVLAMAIIEHTNEAGQSLMNESGHGSCSLLHSFLLHQILQAHLRAA